MKKNNELGRTMIETVLYLSIIAVLAVGLIQIVNSMHDKFKLSKVGEQISMISKGITARYMSAGRYTSLDVEKLVDEKVIPQNMSQGGDVLYHAYGGRVRIKGEKNVYLVTFNNIPLAPCIELALLNWTINDATSLVSLTINNDKYIWIDKSSAVSSKALPVSVTDASESCETGEDNTIIWEFE
ncbi:MAG: hypothetical protein LBR70_02555 [Lactobacillaceae bacterium]|jgi:type II secretory pathway pseudopilin PulG|nr:hypothetical protein [Lactobacillaceae bacterium]